MKCPISERKCGVERPAELMGMDVAWPYQRRELGDTITYGCPNNKLTWAEEAAEQTVTCIWHRQTDSMMWWPQDLKLCNRESVAFTNILQSFQLSMDLHFHSISPLIIEMIVRPECKFYR